MKKKDTDKQFLVLGLGRFGQGIVHTLIDNGYDVLCCDSEQTIVHDVASYAPHVVQADVTSEADLAALGISNFEVVVVAIGSDFEAAVMATMICKELGAKYVLAKANGYRQQKILQSVGADLVVLPEIEMGHRVALNLITSNILDYINVSDEYSIVEIIPIQEWIGMSLVEAHIRKDYHLNVIAIKSGNDIVVSPHADYRIQQNDVLIVVGTTEDLAEYH